MTFEVADPLVLVISRDEVVSGDVSAAAYLLRTFTETPVTARAMFENADVVFHGYDQDSRELFEIPEVRDFVHKLDDEFPFWLFFMSKEHLGLQAITFCQLLPDLTEEARLLDLDNLLNNRWWPAMNEICEYVGFSEDEIDHLSERVLSYLFNGPLPSKNA